MKIYPYLDVEVCLFGYILFEMATGFESPTPSPLDCLHEIPHKLDANVLNILGRVFGDKSMGSHPKIADLINEPFFNATNVPRGDVTLFISLKEENEMVRSMIDGVLKQCYAAYSNDEELSEKVNVAKRKKKKKKKKRKEKVQNIEMEKKESIHVSKEEEQVNVYQEERETDDDLWSSQ